jgi:hypothetical protein
MDSSSKNDEYLSIVYLYPALIKLWGVSEGGIICERNFSHGRKAKSVKIKH